MLCSTLYTDYTDSFNSLFLFIAVNNQPFLIPVYYFRSRY